MLAVALAFAFGSRLVRRIRDLDARTRLIAAGDFRPMPVPPADDELRDLCEAVNDMARRLAEFQDELQRSERLRVLGQFSGGLAHQLRNAATGAKLAVELFLAENPSADPEPLRVALRQLARIESNLRQFLDLGKPPVDLETTVRPGETDRAVGEPAAAAVSARGNGARCGNRRRSRASFYGDATQLSHLFGT